MPGSSWTISGDYFESCNCNIVCPCLVSPNPPLTSKPTDGDCHVAIACHIDRGKYDGVKLDGLNAVLVAKSDGPMANGNITYGVYVDERADAKQSDALEAIFSGAAGGPIGGFAPLFGKKLGTRKARIDYKIDGNRRSAEIPGTLSMTASGLPNLAEGEIVWAATGHPFNPTKLALAVSGPGTTYSDHGMKWDNSGRNGHFAAINWSN